MNGELDWVKADPCYGCRHAKRLDDRQIDGMFGRRFGCVNRGRIDELKNEAVMAVARNELDEAQTLIGNARDMWDDFTRKGYFECSGSLAPACYEKEEKK